MVHHEGELYIVDYEGRLFELLPRAEDKAHLPFPKKLSRTGALSNFALRLPLESNFFLKIPRFNARLVID